MPLPQHPERPNQRPQRPGLPSRPAAPPQPAYEEPVQPSSLPVEPIYEPEPAYEPEPLPRKTIPDFSEPELDDIPEWNTPVQVNTPAIIEEIYEEDEVEAEYEPANSYNPELDEEDVNSILASFSPTVRESAIQLLELIAGDDSSEVLMNGPSEIIFKRGGQRFFANGIDFENIETYHQIINTLILPNTDTKDRIGEDSYLVEGQLELPDLDDPERNPPLIARVHIIAPPAVKAAVVTIAKKARSSFTIEDLQATGSMSNSMSEVLKAFARGRVTMVFSGLSGSGKTTLLEALSYNFDENDRIVVVEDTAELRLPISDLVAFKSTSTKPGNDPAKVITLEWLVRQANRMRPTRIIVGEVRGGEMAEFLSAANSGADGSMTTVHASSPRQTIDKIVSLALKSDSSKNEGAILRDIATTIQIIVQTSLIDGRHVISQIEEISDTLVRQGTAIATNPLFVHDRNTGAFRAVGQPSENLKNFLAQRGVGLDPSWFKTQM